MPRTEIPVTEITRAGVAQPSQTDSDAANGMLVASNGGRIFLEIENTDVISQSVGFAISATVDDEAVDDKTVTIPAGEIRLEGPYPVDFYNQEDGTLYVNPSADAVLKLRAYRLGS